MQSNGKSINVGNNIFVNEASPNIDYKYGTYASLQEAYDTLGEDGLDVITKGLTVGIDTADGIVEYWFKRGTAFADLMPKHADIGAFVTPQEFNTFKAEVNATDTTVIGMLTNIQTTLNGISDRLTTQETLQDEDSWDEI